MKNGWGGDGKEKKTLKASKRYDQSVEEKLQNPEEEEEEASPLASGVFSHLSTGKQTSVRRKKFSTQELHLKGSEVERERTIAHEITHT